MRFSPGLPDRGAMGELGNIKEGPLGVLVEAGAEEVDAEADRDREPTDADEERSSLDLDVRFLRPCSLETL